MAKQKQVAPAEDVVDAPLAIDEEHIEFAPNGLLNAGDVDSRQGG